MNQTNDIQIAYQGQNYIIDNSTISAVRLGNKCNCKHEFCWFICHNNQKEAMRIRLATDWVVLRVIDTASACRKLKD